MDNYLAGSIGKSRSEVKISNIFVILAGVSFGIILTVSTFTPVMFAGMVLCVLLVYQDSLKALSIFLIIIPYEGTTLLRDHLINLPGIKIINLLSIFVIFVAIFNYKKASKIEGLTVFFVAGFITLFGISVFRSLSNLDNINYIFTLADGLESSKSSYVLSYFIKPILYLIPFFIVTLYCRQLRDLKFVMDIITASLFLLSSYLLYLIVFEIKDIADIRKVSEYYSMTLNLHRNEIANFYIIGFPFLIANYFFGKKIISLAVIFLSLVVVGYLYSRTAYAVVAFSFIMYFFLSKRLKLVPILAILSLGLSFLIAPSIIERATVGINTKDQNELAAGRVDGIWIPLMQEYSTDPQKLLFGGGKFALVSSESYKKELIMNTFAHPHNMYIEQIIDNGLIVFFVFSFIMFSLTLKLYKNLKIPHESQFFELNCAILVSLVSFFIAGLTGRTFYPDDANCFFWVVIGMAICINRIKKTTYDAN